MSALAQTIAGLSPEQRLLLEAVLREQGVDLSRSVILPRARGEAGCPLSHAQQRLWFLDQLEPGSPVYNIAMAVLLTGALDRAALAASFERVAARHEVLRTTFDPAGEEPVQRIAPPGPVPLPLIDLSALPAARGETEIRRLADEEALRPFDLRRGPLLRLALLRQADAVHALLLSLHHIIADGWSMGILIREVAKLYSAFRAKRTSPLPPLPIQYADFAIWQRRWLTPEELEEQLGYWREHLAGTPLILDLPADRPRPAVPSGRGGVVAHRVPAPLAAAVAALARREGATLFMTLLAAFGAVLQRYTRREDMVVGTDTANRDRAETEGLIGFFVNQLVLRLDLSGAPPLRHLLARVRDETLASYAHEIPFEKLVESLQPQRDLARHPVFQIAFVLDNAPAAAVELPGLSLRPLGTGSRTARIDLSVSALEPAGGELWLGAEHSTDLFDGTTVMRLLGHLEVMLAAAAGGLERPIPELPLLSEPERRQVLVEWNDTAAAWPGEGPMLDRLFAARAAARPDAVAAACGGEWLSYGELDRRVDRLAGALAAAGAGRGTVVALLAGRSLRFLTAVLAVFRAGGAYLPLDSNHPAHRSARLVLDSGARLVVAERRFAAGLGEALASAARAARPPIALLEDLLEAPASEAALPAPAAPGDLAYVLYTSGSTGAPKGAMIEHRGMLNHLWAKVAALGLDADDAVAQTASPCFDISVWQLLAALLVGGRVQVIPDETAHAPLLLAAAIERDGITILEVVPSLLGVLIDELRDRPAERSRLRALRWMIPTGEALPPRFCRDWLALFPHIPLINAYGPTECSDDVSHHVVSVAPAPGETVPVGRPVPNLRLYVLDPCLGPLPAGIPGELFVGGAGVGRGYLGGAARTAAAWQPDPFAGPGESGARLYRTGDLARFLADGRIELLGRLDHQVKIRGHRIELGEIEAALDAHPAVRRSVVVASGDGRKERRLVAYLVIAGGEPVATAELRSHLKERLPEAMVPAAFVVLAELPLTANGKVDRKALPAPETDAPEPAAPEPAVAPRGAIEEILAGIWGQVLGIAGFGARDDFFDLGGHSLLATRVISRVRDTFGVELPLRALFEAPTVAGLGAQIEEARRATETPRIPPLVPVPRERPLPLSFAQERLWFVHQMDPASPAYNLPFAIRLGGPLAAPALAAGLTEVVRRHEPLRTTLVLAGDEPVQSIAPPAPQPLPVIDLSALPLELREELALRLGREEAARPFDLARPPVVRTFLLRLAERDHALLFTIHHVSGDGWSTEVLARELGELYAAAVERRPARLPELPVQYADFAVWQRSWLQGEVLKAQIEYWRRQLAGIPALLEMPLDRPRPPVQRYRGGRLWLQVPAGLAGSLAALGRREGATRFMTLLAGFQALLHRYGGQESVVVGTPVANRERSELEGLIGFFANTLVLRADFAGDPGFSGVLARVREAALGAYSHQDLPFEKLLDELAPQRHTSYAPLFQAVFIYQAVPQQALRLRDLSLRPLGTEGGVARFDLALDCSETASGLAVNLDYNADLFEAATAERMLRLFAYLLSRVAAEPQRPVGELALLDEAEHRQVVLSCNDTARTRAEEELCLHGLFERQAALTPEAPAVVGEEGVVLYGELAGWAGRIAERLRRLGLGAEDRVGVCLERSAAALAALLGTLRAGAAYVPLDPEWPRERLAGVAADAGLAALLTRADLAAGAGLAGLAPRQVLVEEMRRGGPAEALPARPATPEAAAYVIYTSGSTGGAKGVVISHRAAANFVLALGETLGLEPGDRLLLFAPLSFDASVLQIFPALSRGAAVVVHANPRELAGAELLGFCERHGVTVLDLPAALWRQWIEDMAAQGRILPERLRAFLTGGESVPAARVRAWAGMTRRPATLLSSYGPTEAAVTATVFLTDRAAAGSLPEGNVPIGRPLANVRAYVLDQRMRPVPAGVAGELYLAGDGLARGYLGRPELTAAAFVPDETATAPGGRLYRTGDLARRLSGGDLEFLGRADHQVKIRGFRVEPGEIENALALHPAVRRSAVAVREDPSAGLRFAAYLVAEGAPPAAGALRSFLGDRLPDYMIPSWFIVLEQLPVLASGKVDRRALPAPGPARMDGGGAVAPRNRAELELLRIWEELLQVRPIGVHDDFFALGGHSLLAVRLAARIEQRFGRPLPLSRLLRAATIEGIAASLGSDGAAPLSPHLVPLRAGGTLPPFFCVHPAGGGVLAYRNLVQHLDPVFPFYGLQARGVATEEEPCTRVEEMAALYLDAIREVQPAGPYRLGGWSFGGLVAFEMARQLLERGEEVALLALLDTPAPEGDAEQELDEAKLLAFFAAEAGLEVTREELRPLAPDERLVHLAGLAVRAGLMAEDSKAADLRFMERRLAVFRASVRAGQRYLPSPLPGRITLLRSSERLDPVAADDPEDPDPFLGWGACTSEPIAVHRVPGNHATMMKNPHSQGVADTLHRLLSEVASAGSGA